MKATSWRSSSEALRKRTTQPPPCRELEPAQRVDRDRVRVDPAHVAERDVGPGLAEQLADTVHSPGKSSRAIGPSIANAIVVGGLFTIWK